MVAVLLNSCSEDVVTSESAQTPIDFRIAGTRAATLYDTNNLPPRLIVDAYMTTSGVKYFGQEKFKKVTTATHGVPVDNYLSDKHYYWPVGADNGLSFFAVSGLPESGHIYFTFSSDINTKKLTITNFNNYDEESMMSDLLGAYREGTKADNASGVSLKFHHLLSQVEIKAKSENTAYNIQITGAAIGCVSQVGTLNATWAASNTAPTCEWMSSTAADDKKNLLGLVMYEAGSELILTSEPISIIESLTCIPQTLIPWDNKISILENMPPDEGVSGPFNSFIVVMAKITTKGTGADFYNGNCCIPLSGTWEAGKKYTYILDFTDGAGYDQDGNPIFGKPINFSCTVSDWGVGADTNQNINVN